MINNESYKVVYAVIKISDINYYIIIYLCSKIQFFFIWVHLNFRFGRNQIFK